MASKVDRRHVTLTVLTGLLLNCVASPISTPETLRAVVVYLGSSTYQMQAFTFIRNEETDRNLELDRTDMISVGPVLSAHANPSRSLKDLLTTPMLAIPDSERSKTPLLVKAPPSLGLLFPEKEAIILKEWNKVIHESGYLVTDDCLSILKSDDEAIYSWLTVNYLSGRLSDDTLNKTVTILDLGGKSIRVTSAKTISDSSDLDKHNVNIMGRKMSIHTDSYLHGMGLNAARAKILTHGMNQTKLRTQKTVKIHSVCINPGHRKEWTFEGQKFVIYGRRYIDDKTQNDFLDECDKIIDDLISEAHINPISLEGHEIGVFSGHFWTPAEVGLVDFGQDEEVTVGSLEEASKILCQNQKRRGVFDCLNFKYISALLRKGLGLASDQKLRGPVYEYLKGHKLSTAVGAAIGMLHIGK
ncbi:ectonucleoside triphosphate diphosphohydrolase 5-like [Venturia canescens]|uniref:ectonucleoside triphosphate diphosphohydrolase 5-like n=1 Tax=Venturia canescens TaxID=32260 RepID=UPI001C9C61DE|nr:ectonucleoside triphosphate diphosphohydrolase 5-like [Venturia canescens]